MNNEDFKFCKKIIDAKNFEQFILLKKYEDKLDNNLNKNIAMLSIDVEASNILNCINHEIQLLNQNTKYLLYNNLMYKIRLLFNITNHDIKLENAFLIQKEVNKIEKICLKKLNKYLKIITINNYYKLSDSFLYLTSLITLKTNIDNYFKQCLTNNDCNSNYINANYYDEIDINTTRENIYKIKSLIFNEYENNQEKDS